MSKKAVWLSDIEFIEMHSSDWERLESEAFEADESVQPQLNKNQEQVLGWLKVDYCKKDSLFEALERIGEVYEDPKTEEAFYSLSRVEEAEVIQMFIEWFLDQEGTE
ncbi:hypothetical protein [Enterococcus faecalis]|jgi:hypothetical protein|uniref:hypothetical protein n=1 Tax=Enterococcus faecalis TaxID=1351 RepID=UPI000CF6C4FB|nr:hypothetical protein [Enterococcus faecalis]DAM95826.1 MAG TPA: hypothetical protein [Caudoviricetes sp.]EGO2631660.1 hypothetical protein [Enterococcus faecalis]EGO8804096.1 hypothetical protein [Enterococcus faecalis]EGO8854388.1 hypothetical protein [Enterococcus faecalis]EGO9046514.1 hypothetical protein [Enterococcus faecalis]